VRGSFQPGSFSTRPSCRKFPTEFGRRLPEGLLAGQLIRNNALGWKSTGDLGLSLSCKPFIFNRFPTEYDVSVPKPNFDGGVPPADVVTLNGAVTHWVGSVQLSFLKAEIRFQPSTIPKNEIFGFRLFTKWLPDVTPGR